MAWGLGTPAPKLSASCLSVFNGHQNYTGISANLDSDSVAQGLRCCTSNKLPGNADEQLVNRPLSGKASGHTVLPQSSSAEFNIASLLSPTIP